MRKSKLFFEIGVALSLSLSFFMSCINSDYDLSKNIDATMGLGANGLALKFGNTDTIFLRDLLKVDKNDMLDTVPATHLYYLVKNGTVNSSISVANTDPVNIADVIVNNKALTIP